VGLNDIARVGGKNAFLGDAIAAVVARIIKRSEETSRFKTKNILAISNTDPDWVPVMKKAAGIDSISLNPDSVVGVIRRLAK
jgi:pyruvate,water dikinase